MICKPSVEGEPRFNTISSPSVSEIPFLYIAMLGPKRATNHRATREPPGYVLTPSSLVRRATWRPFLHDEQPNEQTNTLPVRYTSRDEIKYSSTHFELCRTV